MTPELYDWARRHAVSGPALEELRRIMGTTPEEVQYRTELERTMCRPTDENAVSAIVRMEHCRRGGLAWRNNVGAMTDGKRVVRYGLANDSARLNARIKSSDLIGIKPFRVLPEHVGSTVGRFWCRESKAPGWIYTCTEREQAQLRFIQLVLSVGGDAAFTTGC